MRIIKLFFFFLIILATFLSCKQINHDLQRLSLIVASIDDSNSGGERTQDLIRFDFENGELISSETIVTNPGSQTRFNQEESMVYRNRYVITDFGDIVDITAHDFIHRGGSGSEYTRLLGVEGDFVIIHQPQTDAYSYFDLGNMEYGELENPGKWSLPGLLSPDESMSVSSSDMNEGQIWLHSLTGETELLGEGFYVEYSPLSSLLHGVPLLWLDKQRILTQMANGVIVFVSVDGSVTPVVNIDLSEFDFAPIGSKGALTTYLLKDFYGNIIYHITMIGPDGRFRSNRFVIDVENESYSIYNPEWIGLGHEFEYSQKEDYAVLRYKNNDIGREQYFVPRLVRTTGGHLATISRETPEYPTSIKVWSGVSGKWTTMDFEYPIWILYSAVIGWIEYK